VRRRGRSDGPKRHIKAGWSSNSASRSSVRPKGWYVLNYEPGPRFHIQSDGYTPRSRRGGFCWLCAHLVRNKWWEASCLGNPESYLRPGLHGARCAFRPWKHWSMGRVGRIRRRLFTAIGRSSPRARAEATEAISTPPPRSKASLSRRIRRAKWVRGPAHRTRGSISASPLGSGTDIGNYSGHVS
jgi:hypothetical protein